jgi:iron complex transport system permease protein
VIVERVALARGERAASPAERHFIRAIVILVLVVAFCTLVGLWAGYEKIDIFTLSHDEIARSVFFRLRLPRVVLAAIIGATLAAVGAALQAIFRNPLADPLTLGVSGGGALGASIVIALGWGIRILGVPVVFLAAFLGAAVSMAIVYRLAHSGILTAPGSLLLAGIVVNLIANAAVLTIQYTIDETRSLQILRWLIGTLDVVGFSVIWQMLLLLVPGWIALLLLARDLQLLAVDEESAASLGVNVRRCERATYLVCSLLVGVTVSVGGSIGFVGLIVPHIARLLFGQDVRLALPCSLFLGAGFLMLADAAARSALGQAELPVGAVTAILGGPFFLWLMRREQRYAAL